MFWQKKEIKYDILIPPFNKNTQEFSAEEAKEYFNWYMSQIPKRIKYLSKISECNLDMSFDSLVGLWRWFLKTAEIERTLKERLDSIREELKHKPKSFVEHINSESKEQLSLQTEYILRDIGM